MTLIAVLLLIPQALLGQADQAPVSSPAKFEPETFYLAIMSRSPSWDGAKAAKLESKQKSYWQSVADKKVLIAGGPTLEVKDTLAAAMIFRAADKNAALELAKADPFVTEKLWSAEVYPWMTQKDLFAPVTKYEPTVTYYLGFLKKGTNWGPEETAERQRIQDAHLANIKRLWEAGKLAAAGPFLEDVDIRGIFVFRVGTSEEALSLTNTDPAVQAGRLRIELYPWLLPNEALAKSKAD